MTPCELSQARSVAPVLLLALTQGLALGWSSPAVAKLRAGEGPFKPTIDELSWIVSFFSLGILAGSLVGAQVFARAGRRTTLMLGPVLLGACSAVTFSGSSAQPVYLARLLGGAGHGIGVSFSSIYVAEVTDTALRGRLILVTNLLLMAGPLLSYAAGPLLSYSVLALAPLVTAAAALVLAVGRGWMKETPLYLASKGKADEALANLRALRVGKKDEEVRGEFAAILKTVKQQQSGGGSSLRDVFADPTAKRAAILCLVLTGSFAALGITTVLAFTQQIVEEAGAPLSPAVCSVVLVATNIASVLGSMPVVERLGRRTILAGSAFGNAAALGSLTAFLLARDVLGADVSALHWLPLAALVAYMASTGMGIITIPHVLVSELLPQRAKASVAPLSGALVALSAFALHKSFFLVGRALGFGVPFAFFALYNLGYAIFVATCVPETKGKTLAQVQEMLASAAAATDKKKKK
ncbi:facilitated trehalose transporter Tret1-2 homolog isoform X1 [Frankliniella occidentalis]|uniref:Facilitated trehalose transporter Tret1-2 homolog isoform X1 n=1 Tax=Frankliniella occidentalis TaxID=133901 RepID=A0A6J1TG74_FRAOC|nr:facilitated trehalose transporter Tret1-2 homolog isoform X1 [Frankliniella occidentalis]XP_026289816.1 facilitated trehalose transporter Tret1-2 homolog isoform X1 [Frankliniella occidentalis]